MSLTFHIDVVSAEAEIHSGEAEMVFAPAVLGEVGITPRHAPLLTPMRAGDVRIRQPGGATLSLYISGGILEVQPHAVTILSDTVLRAEDIDEAEADEARRQAEQALKGEPARLDYAEAQLQLVEALAKLRVVRLMKGRKGEE